LIRGLLGTVGSRVSPQPAVGVGDDDAAGSVDGDELPGAQGGGGVAGADDGSELALESAVADVMPRRAGAKPR